MKPPSYDLRPAKRSEVLHLFEAHHGYRSLGRSLTYCFAVWEDGRPIAAFAWQPPPPGAAKAVCPEAPYAVLSLSRMVALPREERRLRHISKPLRRQMRLLIDRTRWPILVTYSDEGLGHTGHVYRCSGWQPTNRSERPVFEDSNGARASSYANGRHGGRTLERIGTTIVQRWEHHACFPEDAAEWIRRHGWRRVPVKRIWASGNQGFTFIR